MKVWVVYSQDYEVVNIEGVYHYRSKIKVWGQIRIGVKKPSLSMNIKNYSMFG